VLPLFDAFIVAGWLGGNEVNPDKSPSCRQIPVHYSFAPTHTLASCVLHPKISVQLPI
jgi:hypothetical protein